ncbi:ECF RNA polymerase sigma factor SigW [compost metagenome]
MVSCYRNCAYIHAIEYLYNKYLFKAGTLEIKKQIEKAKIGDQVAFTSLLDYYWNEVYGFMLQRTQNETDAEDITIETFAKAFDKISTYNPDFQFNTWLISIAKNVHIDMLRKKRSTLFVDITDEEDNQAYNIADSSPSAEDKLITEQNLSRLLQFIKELKPHYQEVIQLRYFQELSYQEISEELQEPLSNVKIKLLRAKKLLAEIIKNKR